MQCSITALSILIYVLPIYNRSWKHHKVRRNQNMNFCPHVSSSNDTSKSYYRLNWPLGWNHDHESSIKFLGALTFKRMASNEAMLSLKDNNHECLLQAKRHWNHLSTNHDTYVQIWARYSCFVCHIKFSQTKVPTISHLVSLESPWWVGFLGDDFVNF
jgi:hypothetical protein